MGCVWLGRGVSNNLGLIEALRRHGVRVIGSHWLTGWAGARYLDETFQEPDLGGYGYRRWFEDVLRQRQDIDLAMPGRQLGAFAQASPDLLPRLLLGSVPAKLPCIDDKIQAYAWARAQGLEGAPDTAAFHDLETFDVGVRELRARGHQRLCCKPSVGIFGQGFRVLHDDRSLLDLVLHASPNALPMTVFRDGLAASGSIAPMVLMPAFNGPEVSLDGGWDGQGYRLVARQKHAAGQKVLVDPVLERMGLAIAHAFELRGLFNIQVMQHDGRWWLLEINPRAAGGLEVASVTPVDVVGAALHPFGLGQLDRASPSWPPEERWVFDEVRKVAAVA